MRLIFVSLILLLFDINVTSYEIDILPDFLGWVFMLMATIKMSDIIKYPSYTKTVEIIMFIISVPYEAVSFLPGVGGMWASVVYALAKLSAMTFVLFCFSNIKERLTDKTYFITASRIWLIFLALEAGYFVFAGLIEPILPKSVALAITQAVVIALLFTQVLFLIFIRKTQNKVDLK